MRNIFRTGTMAMLLAGVAIADQQTAGGPTITVKAVQAAVQPGGTVTVEAYVSGALNVSAYQVQLGVTGGTKGTLTLESMTVDKQRQDFAFYQAGEMLDVQDAKAEWVGLVRTNGASDIVKPGYVATFTFRASADAAGAFSVNVRSDSTETFLLSQTAVQIPHKIGQAAVINVGAPAPVRSDGRKG